LKRRNSKKLVVLAVCLLSGIIMVNNFVRPNNQTINAANNFSVDYTQYDWGSGATVSVTITNKGSSAINSWTLGWTFSGNQKIANMWNASFTQSGTSVTATNQSYNATIAANGGKVSFGFNISYSGSNAKPTGFTLNGSTSSSPSPSPSPTVTATATATATATGTIASATPTPTASGTSPASDLPVPSGDNNVAQPSGSAGGLKVLNWAGFKGAVSYSFDDANSSQISNWTALNGLGIHMTFYLQTNKSEASNSIWAQAKDAGHELGNHTHSHAQNGSGSDIDTATNYIKQWFGVTPLTMAAPYGNYSYVSLAQSRFLINRGVAGGSIAPNGSANQYNLPCYIPATGASASAMTSTISSARSAGNWQIVTIHGFTGGSDGAYQPIAIGEFTSHVKTVKNFGDMWIDSVINVGAYWIAQKLFASLSPTNSGSDIVYKWTLPDHFPSGQYLRVTVDGGTLKQNNQTLNWDSHGYYEISLDAGSLTISP
jgi:peptidoglycan/xylan/chitin deacetylase (PgdA/CDA1 family)